MKKAISILLTAILLCASFTVFASAEEDLVNYALNATYYVESENTTIYGLSDSLITTNEDSPYYDANKYATARGDDSDHKKLNDGITKYDECTGAVNSYWKTGSKEEGDLVEVLTENTSVCYTGTAMAVTMYWDLGAVKTDITKIGFLNARCDLELAADRQEPDYLDYIWDAYSRSFPATMIGFEIAGEDKVFNAYDAEGTWTIEQVGLDNPYTDAVEKELVDCRQRNIYMNFVKPMSGRYIKIIIAPERYVLSLDEVQIFGTGKGGDVPPATTVAPTTSESGDATTTTATGTATGSATGTETTVAGSTTSTVVSSDTTVTTGAATTTTGTVAESTPATTKKPATTDKADTNEGGSSMGLIIGIIAAVIVVAAVVVIVLKKKKK